MKSVVKKWGNSASVRIPAAIMKAANVQLDQVVDVREERGRIVIQLDRPKTYSINELVAEITPANRHEPIDFDKPAGKEIW